LWGRKENPGPEEGPPIHPQNSTRRQKKFFFFNIPKTLPELHSKKAKGGKEGKKGGGKVYAATT